MKRKHSEADGTPSGTSIQGEVNDPEAATTPSKKKLKQTDAAAQPDKAARKAAKAAAKAAAAAAAAGEKGAAPPAAETPAVTPEAAAPSDKAARKAAKAAAKAAAAATEEAAPAAAQTPAVTPEAAAPSDKAARKAARAAAKAAAAAAEAPAAATPAADDKAARKAAKKAAKEAAAVETAAATPEAAAKPAEKQHVQQPPATAAKAVRFSEPLEAPKSAPGKLAQTKSAVKPRTAVAKAAAAANLRNMVKAFKGSRKKRANPCKEDWGQPNTEGVDIKIVVTHDPYAPTLKAKKFEALGLADRRRKRMTEQQLQREAEMKSTCGPFLINMSAPGLDVQQEDALEFEAFGNEKDVNSNPAYVVSQAAGANLIGGTHAAPPATAENNAHYVIGIYNRATNTLTLSEAAGPSNKGGCVVRLEAQTKNQKDVEVAGLLKPQLKPQRAQRPQDVAAKRAEARRLVEAFGSTRRKRQLKQREEAQVVVERNADEARLELLMTEVGAKAEAAGETRQEVLGKVGARRCIPVHDPRATQPHLAYRQAAMFPDGLLASLNVGQLMHAAEKKEDRDRLVSKQAVPGYIISRLQRISDEPDVRKRKQRARSLALLAALLQLATARHKLKLQPPRPAAEPGGRDRPGGLEELSWSLRIGRKDVLEGLLDKFYNKTTEDGSTVYVREDYKQQLLLMHVLVVALDVEGWLLPPQHFDALRKELKMTAQDVVARFRELGCTCTSAKVATADGTSAASYNVTLLPSGTKTLEESFPKPKTGAKKGPGR